MTQSDAEQKLADAQQLLQRAQQSAMNAAEQVVYWRGYVQGVTDSAAETKPPVTPLPFKKRAKRG